LIVSPGAMVPSTRSTPESQSAYAAASIRTAQIVSGLAWIVASDS
jgi:hypothetical protein